MHMDKEQFLQMLQSQQSSGLSIQSYCQQHNIPFSSFSYWILPGTGLETDSNGSPKRLKLYSDVRNGNEMGTRW